MNEKTVGQTIAYLIAMLSFLAAAGCVVAVFVYQPTKELDPIRGSLMASTVFFIGVGVVLYVIGTARLKGLISLKPENNGENRNDTEPGHSGSV